MHIATPTLIVTELNHSFTEPPLLAVSFRAYLDRQTVNLEEAIALYELGKMDTERVKLLMLNWIEGFELKQEMIEALDAISRDDHDALMVDVHNGGGLE